MIPVRDTISKTTAVSLGLLLTLGVGEAVVRVFHLFSATRFTAVHPRYGVFNIPGAEGWYVKGEVRQYVTINARGLHDRDPWSAGRRVLLLGDSFIAAFQVPLEASCQEVSERLLSTTLGRPVEVIAGACNGWGTVHEFAFLQEEGFSYDPAWVVLALFPENDLLDNLGPAPSPCPWPPPPHQGPGLLFPGYVRRTAADFVAGAADAVPAARTLVGHARVRAEEALVRGLFHLWNAHRTAVQDRMWARTVATLAAMRDSVRSRGASFSVVVVPGRLAIYPEEAERLVRRKPLLRHASLDPDLPRRRLATVLDSLEIPWLDLAPRFRRCAASGADPFFRREGHWNADGNRIAAEGVTVLVAGLSPPG